LPLRSPPLLYAGLIVAGIAFGYAQLPGAETCRRPSALAEFSCEEIRLLDRSDLKDDGYDGPPAEVEFVRELSPSFLNGNVFPRDHYIYLSKSDTEITISPELPRPAVEVVGVDRPNPTFRIHGGRPDLKLYMEVDTSPDFDGPELWRWPAMVPEVEAQDLKSPSGAALNLFIFSSADADPLAREFEAPFPLVLMSTGKDPEDPLKSLEIKSRLVGMLSRTVETDRTVWVARQIYKYILHSYLIGGDTYSKSAIETFMSGVGECGNLNSFAQSMLEFNGVRSRLVSGFNPIVRQAYPAGGHTLLEVRYDDHWGILDSYLDLFEPDVSARDLASAPLGDRVVFYVDRTRFPDLDFPDAVDMKSLFRYRRYGDTATRMPMQSMVELGGEEEEYGLSWKLRQGYGMTEQEVIEALPGETTIHVRARFIDSRCAGEWQRKCGDADARASEWTVSSFKIAPRQLVSGYLQ
jgi:hypothetical protein